jgi:hypothetical protein
MAATAAEKGAGADSDERHETPLERLDRNTVELVQEMRVAAVGIQVLFAFLLVVPFNNGWRRVTAFDRYDYFVTLLCIATAAALLIAPSIHHRLLFRRGQKAYLVEIGNRLMIVAMVFLTVGLTGILVLISHVIFGAVTAGVVGALGALGVSTMWFGVPLNRRRKLSGFSEPGQG